MKAKDVFRKALYLLDKGDVMSGEKLLKEALGLSRVEGDVYTCGRTLCCLGDLLFELDRKGEARKFLEDFQLIQRDDDVLDEESARVLELLTEIRAAE